MHKSVLKLLMDTDKQYIYTLLIDKLAGNISSADDAVVNDALKNDPAVKKMWSDLQLQLNSPQGKRFVAGINENEAWDTVAAKINKNTRRVSLTKKWLSVAAVLGLGITLSFCYLLFARKNNDRVTALASVNNKTLMLKLSNGKEIALTNVGKQVLHEKEIQVNTTGNKLTYSGKQVDADAWGTLMVPSKLDYQIQLPDGTQVWLNSLTSLRFPYSFTGNTREVYLDGEAYFKVAKDKSKPFIVHTQQTDIQVLGTHFNVNTYERGKTTTSLLEGSVRTTSGASTVLLQPGKQATYEGGKFTVSEFDGNEILSWTTGIHYFNNIRLSDIALLVPRWFDVKVVFDDPRLAMLTFSGAIDKNKPLQVFLTNIETTANIRHYFVHNELHFKDL